MASVMPRSHGGDGAEDPPPPSGFGRGQHVEDLVPAKRTRGKAKNKGLRHAIALNKGRVSLPFDTEVTYLPIGIPNDWFTREVGRYMFGHFAFDKSSYNYVSDAEKNAMEVHLRRRFNFTEIEKHPKCRQLMDGLNAVYMKRYRSRKAKAKEEFLANGGETDVARARANIPKGMSEENWNKTVDYFLTKEHKDRSRANKSNRQKQLYANRGGSSTYSSFCFKKDKTRLEAFKNGHTLKDGRFASELEEQKYEELQAEFESQSEPNIEDEFGEGSSSQVNEVQVFEKVFGARRGHYIGMGRKPSLSRFAPPSCVGPHEKEQTPPALTLTEDFLDGLFENESFLERLSKFMNSKKASKNGNEDNMDED